MRTSGAGAGAGGKRSSANAKKDDVDAKEEALFAKPEVPPLTLGEQLSAQMEKLPTPIDIEPHLSR